MARHSLREEIVEAALEQFHAYGFNAAGVKDITDRAGVPKGSFYNHIDSKEALAVVALQRYAERRRLEDLAAPCAGPLARLRSHFELLRAETRSTGSPADACSATSAPRSPTTATSCAPRSGRTWPAGRS